MKKLWPLALLALVVACSDSDDETNEDDTNGTASAAVCDPACDESMCSYCDVSSGTPTCVSVCENGLTCQAGTCMAPEATDCGGCGPCQACEVTGSTPICVSFCSDGTACDETTNECVAVLDCGGTCDASACEVCDTTGDTPTCVSRCGDGVTCNNGTCELAAVMPHAALASLQGPFDTPQEVTAECLVCHQQHGDDFIQTVHWNWTGDAPNFTDLDGNPDPRTLGKKDLINNFCVAIDSNEARCTHCHAGYGWGAPASENNPTFDFNSTANVDCLVCHASPDSGYTKDPKSAGLPPASVDLSVAAMSVGETSVQSCGACHFYAGGGDNVKKGDLGSALLTATRETDVHMGGESPANRCSSCHAGPAHTILGQGIHLPTQEGRASCTDCHKAPVHQAGVLNLHLAAVACQTCHIPGFSRQQPTKMGWDWSLAGDKTRTPAATPAGPKDYDWMKGEFVWEQDVTPRFAWYDGRVYHTLTREGFPAGLGTLDNPVLISVPTADPGEGQIFPFKVMEGLQFVDITGMTAVNDTANPGTPDPDGCGEGGALTCPTPPFLIVPDLFGPGGFWGAVGTRDDDNTPANKPTEWDIWLGNGAEAGDQISDVDDYSTGERQWDFAYTEMWMGINHEVAPKEDALQCGACHSPDNDDFFLDLGYSCDPREGGSGCRP